MFWTFCSLGVGWILLGQVILCHLVYHSNNSMSTLSVLLIPGVGCSDFAVEHR